MAIKSDFNKEIYEVNQLNKILCFIASGVIGIDDLKVTYKDGSAVVGSGKAILPDKSVITVDKGGYSIPVQIDNGYIYIENGEIKWGDMPQGEGIFLLACIADGKCTDLRKMAYIHTGEGVN